MTFPVLLGAALVLSLSSANSATTSYEEHRKWEQEQLHPRGELSAVQMNRTKAEPPSVLEVAPTPFDPEEAALLEQLRAAKRSGDAASVLQIEQDLAVHRGGSLEFVAPLPPGEQGLQFATAEDIPGGGDRWLPHEFLLAGTDLTESKPSLASDTAGNLYAAIEEETEPLLHSCVVYRSTDKGEHWSRLFWFYGADLVNPSIAVAEGVEDCLLVAFQNASNQTIYVARYSLPVPGTLHLVNILSNPVGVANPRIVTDCSEYSVWYAYLIFNALGVDNWVLLHSRTLDYGDNWTAPTAIAGYCGYPGEFYDASEAHPDLDFGSGNLHVAFDNYPSPCTSAQRNIYVLTSRNYGVSWDPVVQLTTGVDDEHDPAIAAVKHYDLNPTTVVAYTRFYHELDDDVWYAYTQDDGSTWSLSHCIACASPQERNVNLVTSNQQGAVHAAYWDEFNVNYAYADYLDPDSWTRLDSLSTLDTASDIGCRPGIMIDLSLQGPEEAGLAWTDFRNEPSAGLDVYYDAAALPEPDIDYYVYSSFNPGLGSICALDGFVDETGAIEGLPGAQYVFFTGGPLYEGDITAYVYRVETDGDPEIHPDNPLNPGPIATRTFTFVNSHFLGTYASAHDNAFYVDESGIYYGPSDNARNEVPGWATFMGGAIFRWDFNWDLQECVVPTAAPGGNQTLARNPANGDWWAGTANRRMFRWDGSSWVLQFAAPHLGGSHHDGLEVIGGNLFVSDMTSDAIIQYRLDDAGNPLDPPEVPCSTFFYSYAPSVEGMGYEPNHHIWISSGGGTLYEIGGGALQAALEGIPDQCALPGEMFETFDLDDYVAGVPPYSWSWEGNTDLAVSVSPENVVTVTYPPGWMGQETITFTVTDGLGRIASDQAVFTVCPAPLLGNIPDQSWPFSPFDLDDYLIEGLPELISWHASGMICLDVSIDPVTHVATVSDPGGCGAPEVITFTAVVQPCEDTMSDSDAATFDPGTSGVPEGGAVAFSLGYPSPNPWTAESRINYTIPSGGGDSRVTLAIYDIGGQLIRTLVHASRASAGSSVTWDGTNDEGAPVPNGTYFFQLQWNGRSVSRRVMLLK